MKRAKTIENYILLMPLSKKELKFVTDYFDRERLTEIKILKCEREIEGNYANIGIEFEGVCNKDVFNVFNDLLKYSISIKAYETGAHISIDIKQIN